MSLHTATSALTTLKQVKEFLAIQHAQALVDTALDTLFAAIRLHLDRHNASLDRKHDLLCILGVLGKVLIEQVERVALGATVQLAAIPVVRAESKRSTHRLDALGLWRRALAPCEAFEGVSTSEDSRLVMSVAHPLDRSRSRQHLSQ